MFNQDLEKEAKIQELIMWKPIYSCKYATVALSNENDANIRLASHQIRLMFRCKHYKLNRK